MAHGDALSESLVQNIHTLYYNPDQLNVKLTEAQKDQLIAKYAEIRSALTPKDFMDDLDNLPKAKSRKKSDIIAISLNSRLVKEYANNVIKRKNKTGLAREEFLKQYLETLVKGVQEKKLKEAEVPDLVSAIEGALAKASKTLVPAAFAVRPEILKLLEERAQASSLRCVQALQEKLID
jgi:hypothetical protein